MSVIISEMRRKLGPSNADESWARIEREVGEWAKLPHDNSWIGELADRLAATVPMEDWEQLPPDLSLNLDHYLYGSPKQEDPA